MRTWGIQQYPDALAKRDLDTVENCKSVLFILPPALECVKVMLSLKTLDCQHRSEWYRMAAIKQINGPSILPKNPASAMPFLFGLE